MEAVSLIIFCGFSVDYPLHVVQAPFGCPL